MTLWSPTQRWYILLRVRRVLMQMLFYKSIPPAGCRNLKWKVFNHLYFLQVLPGIFSALGIASWLLPTPSRERETDQEPQPSCQGPPQDPRYIPSASLHQTILQVALVGAMLKLTKQDNHQQNKVPTVISLVTKDEQYMRHKDADAQ